MSLLTSFDFWGSPGPARDATYRVIFEAETRRGRLFDLALILAILTSVTVAVSYTHLPLPTSDLV